MLSEKPGSSSRSLVCLRERSKIQNRRYYEMMALILDTANNRNNNVRSIFNVKMEQNNAVFVVERKNSNLVVIIHRLKKNCVVLFHQTALTMKFSSALALLSLAGTTNAFVNKPVAGTQTLLRSTTTEPNARKPFMPETANLIHRPMQGNLIPYLI